LPEEKIRIRLIAVQEYVPNPEYFPAGSSIEDMAKLDCQNAENDPQAFLETASSVNVTFEIKDTAQNQGGEKLYWLHRHSYPEDFMFAAAKDDDDLIEQIANGKNPSEKILSTEYVKENYEWSAVSDVNGCRIILKKRTPASAMRLIKYVYNDNDDIMDATEDITPGGYPEDWDAICTKAGFEPFDKDTSLWMLTSDWNGHKAGNIVVMGQTPAGRMFAVQV